MPTMFYAGQTDYIAKMNLLASQYVKTDVIATTGGTTTLDCSLGLIFYITMGAGNTTIAFSNVPTVADITVYVKQESATPRTPSWPAAVSWAGSTVGNPPTITTGSTKLDKFELSTLNGGTRYFGIVTLNFTA